MAKESPHDCPALELHEWNAAQAWQRRQVHLQKFISSESGTDDSIASADANICIIFANANQVRTCQACKTYFIDKLSMPKHWWTDSSRKSNGYFGCRVGTHQIATWAYFEMKQLGEDATYRWYKLNVFIRWDRSRQQTIVITFDTHSDIARRFLESLENPDPDSLHCPFWFYPCLLNEVARIQESAVWAIRDQVRAVEKETMPKGRPKPDYRHMHDIARHGIHVTETLDVAVQTITRMLDRHEGLLHLVSKDDGSDDLHSQLQFFESFISSLRCRSVSNDKRMLNEIQLAFNTVAQHDASTSLKVAVVALIFLPPTFVSAIFSTSFFNFSPDAGWIVSDKFWLYWAFAAPITILTAVGWYYLRRYGTPKLPMPRYERKRRQTFFV
ncbi:hypothetical protein F4861DRAFT_283028 [Xylaria intraflava]|nr:hypothetical protein F4861DRAFT_283028 [Xylaria intraflava]